MLKTSKLLCLILLNEGDIELSTLSLYMKELVKKGYAEVVNGTELRITKKGMDYIIR
jgi:predicted transcriptional regulator